MAELVIVTEIGTTKRVYIVDKAKGDWYCFDDKLDAQREAGARYSVVESTAELCEPWPGFRCWDVTRPGRGAGR